MPALLLCLHALLLSSVVHAAPAYDPLAVNEAFVAQTIDMTVIDASRHRDIPLRVYLPAGTSTPAANGSAVVRAPVILFSHSLGGSRLNNPYLGQHWAARGYVCVFLQHAGSDEGVWQGKRPLQRLLAMRAAANADNFIARVRDVAAVLDQLTRWDATASHPLSGRLDMQEVGMSGHSFGAGTTQAVSGQVFPGSSESPGTDVRINAAVMFSPSSPRRGSAMLAFGAVKIPWLLMTGTKDDSPIGGQTAAQRRAVFAALPPGRKYELVLNNAEHSVFSDRALRGDKEPRNPNHHRAILALSTAFWDAYLRDDAAAKAWLNSDAARGVLESDDHWQRK